MKLRILSFADSRTSAQKSRYLTIEQQRADAWLDIAVTKLFGVQILKRQINLTFGRRFPLLTGAPMHFRRPALGSTGEQQ